VPRRPQVIDTSGYESSQAHELIPLIAAASACLVRCQPGPWDDLVLGLSTFSRPHACPASDAPYEDEGASRKPPVGTSALSISTHLDSAPTRSTLGRIDAGTRH
jgi:hypothetical protein